MVMRGQNQKVQLSYIGGMNKDLVKTKQQGTTIYEAMNMRITGDSLSYGYMNNIEGTSVLLYPGLSTLLPQLGNYYKITLPSNQSSGFNINTTITYPNGVTSNTVSFSTNGTDEDLSSLYEALNSIISSDVFLLYEDSLNTIVIGYLNDNTGNFAFEESSDYFDIKEYTTSSTRSPLSIIGWCEVREDLILFTTNNSIPNEGNTDHIWKVTFDNSGTIPIPTVELLYIGYLGLSVENPIWNNTVGRYETNNINKVYFTDNYNYLRSVNYTDEYLMLRDESAIDMSADVQFSDIELEVISGGNFNAGKAQYFYQLYINNSVATRLSAGSKLYNLAEMSSSNSSTGFLGSEEGVNTGKSISVTINDIDNKFNRIRLYRVFYSDGTNNPTISIVTEDVFDTNYTYTDNGSNQVNTITYEEFLVLKSNLFTCKTIQEKDNRLFAGNITEKFFFDANIENWDSRAYRFNKRRNGKIYNSRTDADGNINQYVIDGTNPDYDSVPITHGCYNLFNKATINPLHFINSTTTSACMFQSDGTTLGAEGSNIRIGFSKGTKKITLRNDTTVGDGNTEYSYNAINDFDGYDNPDNAAKYTTWQDDEVYRLGIEFENEKGQKSFVKWICDLRIPLLYQNTINGELALGARHCDDDNDKQVTYPLSLLININNIPINPNTGNPYSYRIVKVKRTDENKTVITQGIIQPLTYAEPNSNIYWNYDEIRKVNDDTNDWWSTGVRGKFFSFISPDFSFNRDKYVFNDNCFLSMIGFSDGSNDLRDGKEINSPYNSGVMSSSTDYMNLYHCKQFTVRPNISAPQSEYLDLYDNLFNIGISNSIYVGLNLTLDSKQSIGTEFYRNLNNYTYRNIDGEWEGAIGGRRMIFELSDHDTFKDPANTSSGLSAYAGNGLVFCNYKRDTIGQYGGEKYNARTRNEYVSCSELINPTSSNDSIYAYGDSYTTMFDYMHGMLQTSTSSGGVIFKYLKPGNIVFPVTSQYNNEYRITSFNRLDNKWNFKCRVQETVELGNILTSTYAFTNDLYDYNKAYIREDETIKYFTKPFDYNEEEDGVYDTRVQYSDVKINGETQDSWLDFRPNNFIDVDNAYGAINKIVKFMNKLFYLQSKAFGYLAINEKALTSATTAGELALGTGGVLSRFETIYSNIGSIHPTSIIVTPSGVYWFDFFNRGIYNYNGKASEKGLIKGLDSFLNNEIDNVLIDRDNPMKPYVGTFNNEFYGIHTGYDYKNKEVLFTFMQGKIDSNNGDVLSGQFSNNAFTLVYKEAFDIFQSFYSIAPLMYLNKDSNLMSIPVTDKGGLHIHNYGNYGEFYGDDAKYSYVTLIVNPVGEVVNIFNNVQFNSEVIDESGTAIHDETITSYKIDNDYQSTGLIDVVTEDNPTTLTEANIRRWKRLWSFAIERSNTDPDIKARIRDSYIKMQLLYLNNNNKSFKLHDIFVSFVTKN